MLKLLICNVDFFLLVIERFFEVKNVTVEGIKRKLLFNFDQLKNSFQDIYE